MNAIDAQKIGLVNEIISDGVSGRNQLIKKIKTEIAIYKMVKKNPASYAIVHCVVCMK